MLEEQEARARFLLGRLLADVSADRRAAELFREAIRLRPGMAEAHVGLGFVLGRGGDYVGMVGAFRDAISIDAAAVRASINEEPGELGALRRILYPERPAPAPAEATPFPTVPDYARETGALVGLAREHLAAGRDEEAAAALVSVLWLDAKYRYAVSLLTLTCLLLLQAGDEAAGALVDAESLLREAEPQLAKLLFVS